MTHKIRQLTQPRFFKESRFGSATFDVLCQMSFGTFVNQANRINFCSDWPTALRLHRRTQL